MSEEKVPAWGLLLSAGTTHAVAPAFDARTRTGSSSLSPQDSATQDFHVEVGSELSDLKGVNVQQQLSELDQQEFDVAIVGGGINGCAISQHLAAAGYKVVVIEKNDFASGATSRSARILHCGLRHMAPEKSVWEFLWKPRSLLTKLRNAYEMATGQVELARTIPSRLRKVDLVLPIYRGAGFSGWQVDLGARLIKFFNRDEVPMNYRRWKNVEQSTHPFARHLNNKDRLESIVAFDDLQFAWPERIALDAILNAEEQGTVIRNFTEVTALSQRPSGIWDLSLKDVADRSSTAQIRAKLVLNLAGAWIDEVAGRVRTSNAASQRVIGVKGVHLLVRLPSEYQGTGLVGTNSENEPLFCLPMGDLHYIGPTETIYHGDIDDIVADDEDVDFILQETNHLLPQVKLTSEDVILTWAGVRPITYDKDLPKGKRLPYGVMHDFKPDGMHNMLGITWGIIVTHRETARSVVKEVGKRISPSRKSSRITSFERDFPASDLAPLQTGFPYTVEHVEYAVKHEHAKNLAGLFFGRFGMGWSGRLERTAVELASTSMASLLNWDEGERIRQIAEFERYMAHFHRAKLVEVKLKSIAK